MTDDQTESSLALGLESDEMVDADDEPGDGARRPGIDPIYTP